MPALSPTMEEGKLSKWLVKEGDTVKSGDILAEIETDKGTMEVEAGDEGTSGKLLVAEGTEGVKVNAPIATLLGDNETASLGTQPSAAPRDGAGKAKPAQKAEPDAPVRHPEVRGERAPKDEEIPEGTEMVTMTVGEE